MEEKVQEEKKVEDTSTESQSEAPQYTEAETLAMTRGWKPKEEWEGDEKDWKPASVFNEIGELKEKIVSSEKELKKTNKVIQLMKEHHLSVRQSAYKEAMEVLKEERQKALKEQDFAKAEEIRDEIDEVKVKFTRDDVLPKEIEKKLREDAPTDPDPEFYAFVNRNPWYKPNGSNEMSKKADALGWAYKQENPDLSFGEIIKQVEKDIKKLFPEKFDSPRNPVNESGNRSGDSSSKTKVKLSDQEREVAKSFGMTEEAYAKELLSYKGR